MKPAEIEKLFDDWARYETHGNGFSGAAGKSIFERLEEGMGQLLPSGSGGGFEIDTKESRLSGAVSRLALNKRLLADILRLEYGVITRKGSHPTDTQMARADAIGLTLRTYSRKLSAARKWVLIDAGYISST